MACVELEGITLLADQQAMAWRSVYDRRFYCRIKPAVTDRRYRRSLRSTLCANQDCKLLKERAGHGIRTRDFDLGKVALYH
jgi:hypothetical protein